MEEIFTGCDLAEGNLTESLEEDGSVTVIVTRKYLFSSILQIGYGDVFKQKVGNPEKYIRDGMAHVQAYYCHPSFGSMIDFYYPIIEHIPGYSFRMRYSEKMGKEWEEWQDLLKRVTKLTKDTHYTPNIYTHWNKLDI